MAPLAEDGLPAVIFFDVDGTLIWDRAVDDPDNPIVNLKPTPAVYQAFDRLRENGHTAFICTGRTLDTIHQALLDLHPAGIISGAGACVSVGGKILAETSIPVDLLERTVGELMRLGVDVVFEGAEQSVALMKPGETYRDIPGVKTAHSWDELREIAPNLDFEKFAFFASSIPVIKSDGAFFLAHFDLCDLGIGLAEMSLKGVDKGVGVRHALEALGSAPRRTYAFGDSENDLPMLREVDVPVAMGNALPQVKDIASYVTGPVWEDGVVTGLEFLGLI